MSKNCYLIISPDPSENRELKIFGKAYSKTESSKVKPEDAVEIHPDQLHFVKFGDEVSTEDRVKDYRTHNPTCKLCNTSIAFDPGSDVSDSLVANNRARRCNWSR